MALTLSFSYPINYLSAAQGTIKHFLNNVVAAFNPTKNVHIKQVNVKLVLFLHFRLEIVRFQMSFSS